MYSRKVDLILIIQHDKAMFTNSTVLHWTKMQSVSNRMVDFSDSLEPVLYKSNYM